MGLELIGRFMILSGIILLLLGGIFIMAKNIPFIGHLPGDILIRKENFSFYFPLTTCILLSLLFSLIFWLFHR
ncbi:MAG: DUF2905 domain-containing protein [Candidatus Omnitrophota bacterium]|nr:MAG: DUF2905 domain-containing protein [Candidatus Omnitrophota bacterium]